MKKALATNRARGRQGRAGLADLPTGGRSSAGPALGPCTFMGGGRREESNCQGLDRHP